MNTDLNNIFMTVQGGSSISPKWYFNSSLLFGMMKSIMSFLCFPLKTVCFEKCFKKAHVAHYIFGNITIQMYLMETSTMLDYMESKKRLYY